MNDFFNRLNLCLAVAHVRMEAYSRMDWWEEQGRFSLLVLC
jgi:hypothetical protein